MSEPEIIAACQKGDLETFVHLYDLYVHKIYSFILHKTLHQETAEDLTSETFIKAMEKINTYHASKAAFKTWLYQIARNTVTDHYRKHRSMSDIDDVWDLDSGANVEDSVQSSLSYQRLQKHLKKLKPAQREILQMRFWQDMSYREIAQTLGKTESAVKMTTARAVEHLRGEWSDFMVMGILLQMFLR